jgi:hypothetical protein
MKISPLVFIVLSLLTFAAVSNYLGGAGDDKLYCPGCYDSQTDCQGNCTSGKCAEQEPICYTCYGCWSTNSACNDACHPCTFNPNSGWYCCSMIWSDIKPCVLECGKGCAPFRTKSWCCSNSTEVEI